MPHSKSGSHWHRWDLHFHTPSSFDYENRAVTDEQIVEKLVSTGVRVVAITDHHTMDVERIKNLKKVAGDRLTVLPGIELRSELGTKPIHYICIFSEDSELDELWTKIQGELGLTPSDVVKAGGDDKIYVSLKKASKLTRVLGGVVSVHAGAKSNSIEGIENKEQFQQKIKYDVTKEYIDILEIGQLKDVDTYLDVVFPAINLERPLVICSDNHDIDSYSTKAPLWIRADPTFRGLLMLLREPSNRAYIGERPPEVIRVKENPTKYVRNICFTRSESTPDSQAWFTGQIDFNPGLVAIVGNKGSGKSALADVLGLLGCTKNTDSFSFLSPQRFRHRQSGFAQHFGATMNWHSGEKIEKKLDAEIGVEEVERIKYLPQDHVESVCNELEDIDETGFEDELGSVIFSHVPESDRLGYAMLDELIDFKTGEKQKRIDALIKSLRQLSRQRVALEHQANPDTRAELEEKIKRKKIELDAHDKIKPKEVAKPQEDKETSPETKKLIEQLDGLEKRKKALLESLDKETKSLEINQRVLAVTDRLIEKMSNFGKDYEVFRSSIAEDAAEIGVEVDELVTFTMDAEPLKAKRTQLLASIRESKKKIDSKGPPGLRMQLDFTNKKIAELQSQMDAPNQKYQAYLKSMQQWKEKRSEILGTDKTADSLRGLEATLGALDSLPGKIDAMRERQGMISRQIHDEKVAQVEYYRTLYAPVQEFVDTRLIADGKLSLEFRADLVGEGFEDRLLEMLSLNRRGSFMGVDDGRARAEALVEQTDWDNVDSVHEFLAGVDRALHYDLRDGQDEAQVQLAAQLAKTVRNSPEALFDYLYGLEYVRPRYVLRWDGKDLSMLSPGERGILLLVFYLLIDKSDIPLIIDQPEGNLDNHTVAMVLVACIKEARKRRQVFIVTHNPNLAVVCDADQVIHASIDKEHGNAITYTSGSLEDPAISQHITDVLEGTRWAFGVRDRKYKVSELPPI